MRIQYKRISYCLLLLLLPFFTIAQSLSAKQIEALNARGNELLELKEGAEDFDEKIRLLNEAINCFQKTKNWKKLVETEIHLSGCYYYLNDFEQFEKSVLKEQEIIKMHVEESDSLYYMGLDMLVLYYETKEDYQKAEIIYKKLFNYDLEIGNESQTMILANNIAYFYNNYIGDQERALEYYKKAIQLYESAQIKDDGFKAIVLSNIGYCYKELEVIDSSFLYFNRALSSLEAEDHSYQATLSRWWTYQNLSEIHLDESQLDSCKFYSKKAEDILREGNSYWDDYQTFQTIGKLHLKQNDFPSALAYFEKGLSLAKRQEEVFRPVNAFIAFAKVLSDHGENHRALDSLQNCIQLLCPNFVIKDIYKTPQAIDFVHKKSALDLLATRASIFYEKYKAHNEQRDLIAALDNYSLANEIIRLTRQDYAGDASKYYLAEKALPIYEKGIDVAFQLYKLSDSEEYLNEAFHFAEQNKSVLLLESIRDNAAKGFGEISDSLLNVERLYKVEIAFWEKARYNEMKKTLSDQKRISTISDKLFNYREAYQELIDYIEKQYPKYYELKYNPQIASVGQIQKSVLTKQNALLEYFIGDQFIFLFCIQKNKSSLFKIEKPNHLFSEFNELRAIYSKVPNDKNYKKDLAKFNAISSSLYKLLLAEATQGFSSEINELIIIPDDFLNFLPFEIMKLESSAAQSYSLEDQEYLIERFAISYNFSSSLLLNIIDVKHSSTQTFAGFAPTFENKENALAQSQLRNELSNLSCNQEEVNAINQLLKGTAFIGELAIKQNFENILSGFEIIHLATHASIDMDNPKFNRIYFKDDFLSIHDLSNLDIKTNLVVLSACNTNAGSLMKGNGVSSLSKGFALAGCPSMLTSLWSVDDCTTSDIMVQFYQPLSKNKSKSISLKEAKIEYLSNADHAGMHPFYWAPFMMSGNTNAIIDKSTSTIFGKRDFLLIALAGVFLLILFKRKN